MTWKELIRRFLCLVFLLVAGQSWAAHPLITDDTGTQGKGKFQLELNGQHDWNNQDADNVSTKTTGGQVAGTLSYGIAENVDLVLSLPYQWGKTEENESIAYDEKGIGDIVFETKWRFFEKNGFSLVLKPGISIPTGNDEKGLGTGQMGGHLFLIGSKEMRPCAFHANLGYIRNENKVDEHKDIWHVSLATTWEIIKDLKMIVNIGIERNPDDESNNNPAFLIGGFIYSITENFDLDCGVKYGLSSSENDLSLMAGIAFRF